MEVTMLISKIMRTNLVLAPPECKFETLICQIAELAPRQVYIVNEDLKLLGIITGYDLLKLALPTYADASLLSAVGDSDDFLQKHVDAVKDKKASDFMVTKFTSLNPDDHALEAEALLVEKKFNALPVINKDGILVGEVHRRDVLTYMARLCFACNAKKLEATDLSQITNKEEADQCYKMLMQDLVNE
jgi:CBS domain-containing protein